ncbi:unnamed protein product [Cyprideis torosa]|uniref:Uncharacterized protein n=1 Tax=Cyprideis torosa TaxID=163714 RepID=A0A7R8ZPL9_9CRUS|nr:unnamed protein product [Cyprideis torosa]CAG0894293.1 unnamed protein product [Cyprideis torosa]
MDGRNAMRSYVPSERKDFLQVAEAITLTVAKSFDMAFELWKKAHEDVAKEHNSDEDSDEELNTELIQKEPSPEEREKTAPKSPQTNNAPILPPPPPTKEAPPLLDLSSEPVSPVAPSLPPPLVPGNTTEVPAKRSSPPKAWSPGVAGGGGRLPKPPSMKQLQKVASHHAIQKMGFQDDFSSMNARFSQIAITPERNSMLSTSARSKLSARDLKQIAFEHSHSDLTTLAETHETGLPNWDEILKQPSDHHEPTSSLFIIGGDDDPWSPKSTPSPPPSHSNSNPFR